MPIKMQKLSQFQFFKLALAGYLAMTYLFLIWERDILLPPYNTQFIYIPHILPVSWILGSTLADVGIILFLLLGVAFALSFALYKRHWPWALLSWFVWTQVMAIHPIYFLPQDGFVGWFLLASLLVPSGLGQKIPRPIWLLAWYVTGVSYFASAATKLQSASWLEGETLSLLYNSALARTHGLMPVLRNIPDIVNKLLTWGALGMEFLLLPLSLFEKGRQVAWALLLSFHVFVFCTVDITSVTLAFFVFLIFLWGEDWRRPHG